MPGELLSIQTKAATPLSGGVATGVTPGGGAPGGAFAAALAQAEVGTPESEQATTAEAGQGFAGALGADWSAPVHLAAVHVSPALRAITDGQMDVAPDALVAFAQQQGLSPEAVRVLQLQVHGEGLQAQASSAPKAAASGQAPQLGVLVVSAEPQLPSARMADAASVLMAQGAGRGGVIAPPSELTGQAPSGDAVLPAGLGVHPARPRATTMIQPPTLSAGLPPAAGSVGAQVMRQVPVGLESPVAPLEQVVQSMRDEARQAGGMLSAGAWAGRSAVPPGGVSEQLLAQSPQLGVAVLPIQAVFKLAQINGPLKQPTAAPAPATDALVLEDVASADVLELLSAAPSLSRHAHAAAPAPTPLAQPSAVPGGALPAVPNSALAQAKYEAVAQQLGEAIGQRLQSQIQRGHWQVSLRLHPQELGSIDVQLGMRGGDLVAQFQASQQLTRDMLQDQMPRLREMLSAAGIDVASTGVGSQSGGRSGGNSTPSGQSSGTPRVDAGASVAAVPQDLGAAAASGLSGGDGLDLWA